MKKTLVILLVVSLFIDLPSFPFKAFSSEITSKNTVYSNEQISKDIISTLLLSNIQNSIQKNYKAGVTFDLFGVDYLDVKRIGDTFTFIIKVQVKPFVGAHNTIGIDNITFEVSPGEVKVISNEHIKDYPLPLYY